MELHEETDGQLSFVEDVVNHPSHYCQDGGMECIDEMIAIFGKTAVKHFCLLNVWKYRKRAVFKNGAEDMKKAEYMEDQIGKIAEGVISGVTKFGFFVELENTVEGLVHVQKLTDDYYHYDPDTLSLKGERTKKIYRLGQRVKIKVTGASKLHQEIDFDLVRPRKEKREPIPAAKKKAGPRKEPSRPAEPAPIKNKRRRNRRRKPKPTQA